MAISSLIWLTMWVAIVPLVAGWSPIAVTSGSMAPRIDAGDIVLVTPYEDAALGPGTVIVFETADSRTPLAHRIVGVTPSGEYTTRGDANDQSDSTPVSGDDIVGVGRLLVPVIGHPFVWAEEGRWDLLAMLFVLGAGALWISRWGLLSRYEPWASDDERARTDPVARPDAMELPDTAARTDAAAPPDVAARTDVVAPPDVAARTDVVAPPDAMASTADR